MLTVYTLTHYDNIRGGVCAAKGLVVETESTDNIGITTTTVVEPYTQVFRLVEGVAGRNEYAQAALFEFAHILGDTEIVNAAEAFGQVFLLLVIHMQVGHERHIGNGKVLRVVGYLHILEACVVRGSARVELCKYACRDVVYLYGGQITAMRDTLGHQRKDITDTRRTL